MGDQAGQWWLLNDEPQEEENVRKRKSSTRSVRFKSEIQEFPQKVRNIKTNEDTEQQPVLSNHLLAEHNRKTTNELESVARLAGSSLEVTPSRESPSGPLYPPQNAVANKTALDTTPRQRKISESSSRGDDKDPSLDDEEWWSATPSNNEDQFPSPFQPASNENRGSSFDVELDSALARNSDEENRKSWSPLRMLTNGGVIPRYNLDNTEQEPFNDTAIENDDVTLAFTEEFDETPIRETLDQMQDDLPEVNDTSTATHKDPDTSVVCGDNESNAKADKKEETIATTLPLTNSEEPSQTGFPQADVCMESSIRDTQSQQPSDLETTQNKSYYTNDDINLETEDLIFAYGSLINAESRKRTLPDCHVAIPVDLSPKAGYERSWCFQSSTGFTALGIQACKSNDESSNPHPINGVLHYAGCDIAKFDAREIGYSRVEIDPSMITLRLDRDMDSSNSMTIKEAKAHEISHTTDRESVTMIRLVESAKRDSRRRCRIWIYVPNDQQCKPPSEDFPICQTYLDTVMEGCLQIGGTKMAEQFILSTTLWSQYFLNDIHTSRRPWLHRKHYQEIDALLNLHRELTMLQERRHPEEYANAFHTNMRGMWGIPKRSNTFVGRERELNALEKMLVREPGDKSKHMKEAEIVGLGGVGKTQLATEFCYRQYPDCFGLIFWLNAESSDTIAEGLRKLAMDIGIDVRNAHIDDVVGEVRSRLIRARCAWLIVFDNLEDAEVVKDYLPTNGQKLGHVLITGRQVFSEWMTRTLELGCFDDEEAIGFLDTVTQTSAGVREPCPENVLQQCAHSLSPVRPRAPPAVRLTFMDSPGSDGSSRLSAGAVLANHLGHHPLALAMAAGYMQRCDVDCVEYLQRLGLTGAGDSQGLGYTKSLGLSLERITKENPAARALLDSMCYLASDGLTKVIFQTMLLAPDIERDEEPVSLPQHMHENGNGSTENEHDEKGESQNQLEKVLDGVGLKLTTQQLASSLSMASAALIILRSQLHPRRRALRRVTGFTAACFAIGSGAALYYDGTSAPSGTPPPKRPKQPLKQETTKPEKVINQEMTVSIVEEADIAWGVLKSFSLLSVRDNSASIHRLLQKAVTDRHSEEAAENFLSKCLWTISRLWHFKKEEPKTWPRAGQLLEHIKATTRRALDLNLKPALCAELLTDAGHYISVALSRFNEAEQLLRLALQTHEKYNKSKMNIKRARTLHHLGMVMRYLGNFELASEYLWESLEIRQQDSESSGSLDEASTLHELGVTRIKVQDPEGAEIFLQQCLDLLNSHKEKAENSKQPRDDFVSSASTLYQLAVAKIVRKPPRLNEAELLLKKVLDISEHKGAARSSTLQQLGRVAVRRGNWREAEEYFQQALEGFKRAYRSDHHVNISSVFQALGNLAMNRKQYDIAEKYFLEALRVRTGVYGSDAHLDVSAALGALGNASRARGDLSAASKYFERQRAALEKLQRSKDHSHRATQEMQTTISILRSIARECGDKGKTRELTEDLQELRNKGGAPDAQEKDLDYARSKPFIEAAITCRKAFRDEVLKSKKKLLEPDADVLLTALAELQSVLSAVVDVDGENATNLKGFKEISEFSSQSESILSEVGEYPISDKKLLACCDALRNSLRKINITVVDKQTK
eukprot:m.144730 g.144730  ORF g.144730 m.144730 type:complete len:1627 (-) comp14930_c0_seq1:2155-7035(-)